MVSGTLLSTALSACSLELTASANSITINKTITVAITQQAPIAEITTVSVSNPASNPGAETNPTIDLSPLTIGDTISLYSDSSCSSLIESFTASSASESHMLLTPLSDGTYTIYAMATNATNSSVCSSTHADYTLDTAVPNAATLLSYDAATSSSSSSPLISGFASTTPLAEYRVSLGSSMGAKDIIADEDVKQMLVIVLQVYL